jgi:hypothetical protein
MKSFLIAIILLGSISTVRAQKPITIYVERLKKPTGTLKTDTYQTILEDLIRSDSTNDDDPFNKKRSEPKFNIVAKSTIPYGLVNLGYHPFFEGMYHAYAEHRPFTLSPDMVWLLICQGFSQHVNNNSEDLRSLLVDFKGKTTLVVRNDKITLDNPNSPWNEVFPEFSKQISEHTGKELTETLTSDFSTTTEITKMASQITLMDAVKSYFNFVVIRIGCGIPKITIEGNTQDWQRVLTKTEALRKYKLDWWVDKMEPVIKKIIAASQGEVDKSFWQNMFKSHSKGMCLAPTIVDGWIVKFFPYNKLGKRNNLDSVSLRDALPNEMVKVDLQYENGDGAGNFTNTPLEIWAGFVGLKQNDENFGLKPEIGWMIRKKQTGDNEKLKARLKNENRLTDNSVGGITDNSIGGGIMIRAKTVPDELLHIGPIHKLTIYFTDGIRVPDEMGNIKIDELAMYGDIKMEDRARIYKLFIKTKLSINGQPIVNGKAQEVY